MKCSVNNLKTMGTTCTTCTQYSKVGSFFAP